MMTQRLRVIIYLSESHIPQMWLSWISNKVPYSITPANLLGVSSQCSTILQDHAVLYWCVVDTVSSRHCRLHVTYSMWHQHVKERTARHDTVYCIVLYLLSTILSRLLPDCIASFGVIPVMCLIVQDSTVSHRLWQHSTVQYCTVCLAWNSDAHQWLTSHILLQLKVIKIDNVMPLHTVWYSAMYYDTNVIVCKIFREDWMNVKWHIALIDPCEDIKTAVKFLKHDMLWTKLTNKQGEILIVFIALQYYPYWYINCMIQFVSLSQATVAFVAPVSMV